MSDGEGPHAKRARQDGTSDAELVDCRPYAKPGHSCGSCSHCLSADHSSSDEASDDDQPSDRSDSDSDSDVSQTGSDDEPALSDCETSR